MAALAIMSQVFMLWMLVDAAQRRMQAYWYVIILMPLGEWVYFFAVKVHDYDLDSIKKLLSFERPASVADMEHRFEETPSVENQLALADALRSAGQYPQARVHYQGVLQRDDNDRDALFGVALVELGIGDADAAIGSFSRLIDVDPSYHDWKAWPQLAFAYSCAEKGQESLEVFRKLVEKSPRISHKVLLGKALVRDGNGEEAVQVLRQAIDDYRYAPVFVKRLNGRWHRQGRMALKQLKIP